MRRSWVLLGLLVLLSTAWAGEPINLTTPEQATTGTPSYHIARLDLDWDGVRVTVYLNSPSGITKVLTFTGADATIYMRALNKRDSSVTSAQKWTLNKLNSKGWLSGTVSGTPD